MCPECKSENVEHNGYSDEMFEVIIYWECLSCGNSWEEKQA